MQLFKDIPFDGRERGNTYALKDVSTKFVLKLIYRYFILVGPVTRIIW